MFRGVTSASILWAVEVFGSVLGFFLVYVSFGSFGGSLGSL